MDFTTLWVYSQKHKSVPSLILLALLIFAGGWQLGRAMSPYYAAHPIVFEETSCPGQPSANGDPAALDQLKQAGIGLRENDSQAAQDQAAVSPVPNVAGTSNAVETPQPGQRFVGSKNSDLFHDPVCSSAARIKPENQVWFGSIEEAKAAGYNPSKCTQEKLGIQ